jgi:predicted transposase YbfD/YdcC
MEDHMATKRATRQKRSDKNADLKLLCSRLLAENGKLEEDVRKLREENRQLMRSLGALLCDDISINKRAMLAESAKEPSLVELIAELENSEA